MRPQLSQKIADKLVERIVKEIELGNTLLNYEIDSLANDNNTLYRDPKSVNMVQTKIGKAVSEMMKALGFVPAPSNMFIDNVGMEKVSWVMGDGTKLREVMLNIINNPLDAMPEGGRISFDTWKNNGNVFLSISDTGHGMPKDVQRQIFDPFFTTKRAKIEIS